MPSVGKKLETPVLRIDLSHHSDKFGVGSHELVIAKRVNFIFGKNGTGKTTISDEIQRQLSTDYDVCVFKDFDGVVENERLNAIALGTENAAIQKEIESVDGKITEIRKQIDQPEDKNVENLFTKAAKTKADYSEQEKKINAFFTDSAREIKNLSNPQIAQTSYNKASFQDDMAKANLLSEDSVATYKNTIKAEKKADVANISFQDIDLSSYLKSTNDILQSSVAPTQDIPELTGKTDKQAFARQGMSIHEHKAGEICAFCGNKITDERWQLLANYFNDEVKKLENRIANGIAKISSELDGIKEIKEIKKENFYDRFEPDIKDLNQQIVIKINKYKEFLTSLQTALEKKKSNLFVESPLLDIAVPESFSDIEKGCKNLVKNHNEQSQNLSTEQNKAKNALRYHEIKKLLDKFNYDNENIKLATFRATSDEAEKALESKKSEFQDMQKARKKLILQTKDEEQIAEKINKLLSNMGVISFSLELVADDDENQKGQYQIKGHDESIRQITKLSKGEKNIVAFLYFIFSLESVDSSSKPKIIVLDDPMTSNDDTMQYLMIGEIQKFYRTLKDSDYFILLTHNCHFYLNVYPYTRTTYRENGATAPTYTKYGVHHLFSDGKRTTIKSINNETQDFKTSYETLWKELVFLYNADDATPDLMLSPCRKICETYMNFTKKTPKTFYDDNMNAKKLFDVNQHSIDDFEAELNGKTKNDIKNILYKLFEKNNAEDHFNNYWRS